MLKTSIASVGNLCSTFSAKSNSCGIKKYCLRQLPLDRYEEYIDFIMNYYVKYEMTHIVSGIPKSAEAMHEYREILDNTYRSSYICKMICCLYDEDDLKIVGISAQKLIRVNDMEEEIKPQTKAVKRFYEILKSWNKLYPVPELMKKYNITTYCDDLGIAIHPLYRGHGFAERVACMRREVCNFLGAPLTGAWMTSLGSQKAALKAGWEVVYQISYEDLGQILGVTFENVPPSSVYMIAKSHIN